MVEKLYFKEDTTMDEEQMGNVGMKLNDTINDVMDSFKEAEEGSNNRKQDIEALEKFYKLRIEEIKAGDEFYNNQERRKLEKETNEKRLELDLQMHKDKMQLELERLEMDREAQKKDLEMRETQAQLETKKLWMDIAKSGVALGAWVLMSYKVMKFEETGTIRSKAFAGVIPKLKFW